MAEYRVIVTLTMTAHDSQEAFEKTEQELKQHLRKWPSEVLEVLRNHSPEDGAV